MGLFRRRQGRDDPDLPLDRPRADRLRREVRRAFADHGRDVTVHGGHAVDADHGRFGLWNLAALCASEPEATWPELVARHVATLVEPRPGLDDLPDDQLADAVRLRIFEAAAVPADWHPTAPRLSDDLLVLVCVDLPDEVLTPSEAALAARGAGGIEQWRETALTNLRAMIGRNGVAHELVVTDRPADAFHLVVGESFFTASLALVLDDLLAAYDASDLGRGVLVAVPYRHQLLYRVIDGPDAVLALQQMVAFARIGFPEAPGPLSPEVFWVRGGRWHQVTQLVDGAVEVHADGEFADALGL